MDVKEFYYQKADELIEKLKSSQVKASTMKKVYKKLEDLEDVKTTFALDDEDITVDLPAKVKEIQKKWKNEAAKITELEKVEAKAEAEAAEAKLKQEMAEWEEKVEKLKSDRNKEEQERTEQIKKSISDQKARLLEVKEEKLANCEKEINTLKHQLAEDQWELERLGFFKSSRKKELTLAIESITAKVKEKEDSLGVIQREYQRDMEAADSSEAAKLKALSKELERKYEIPKSPKEIAMRKWEDENRKANMTEHEYENYKIKEAILDALSRCGSPLTTTDITNSEQVQAFATIEQPISKNKVTALLTQLINEEKVTKTYDRKVAYFRLCNFQYDDQDVVGGNPERTMEVQNEWKPEKTEENRISELSKKESAIPKKKKQRLELGDLLSILIGSAVIIAFIVPCILSGVHSATTHTYVDPVRSGAGLVILFIAMTLIIIPWVAFFETTTKVIVIIGSIIILLGGVCMGIGSTVSSDAPYGSGPIVITGMVLICSGVIFFVSMCWYNRFKGRGRK